MDKTLVVEVPPGTRHPALLLIAALEKDAAAGDQRATELLQLADQAAIAILYTQEKLLGPDWWLQKYQES